jgi:DNA replication and repair protein RecF
VPDADQRRAEVAFDVDRQRLQRRDVDNPRPGLGAEIVTARLQTLAEMAPFVAEAYLAIAPSNNVATVAYRSSSLGLDPGPGEGVEGPILEATPEEVAAHLRTRMADRRGEEIARGVTLVGPHRDDLVLSLGHLPAKGYASHGESWSFALALRLGAYALLRADGVEPVLILDDVFAELDEVRRERLAERIAGAEQVIITAAVASDVPASLAGRRWTIHDGSVTLDDEVEESDAEPAASADEGDADE